jgi:hypothetical protein
LFFCILVLVSASACKIPDTSDSLKLDNNSISGAVPVPASEKFGQGKMLVSMLLDRSGPLTNIDAANYRDGAVLAVKDLGSEHITLSINDTRSDVDSINLNYLNALDKKSSLIIIGDGGHLVAKSKITTTKSSPPIILIDASSPKVSEKFFRFRPDGIDSVIAGIKHASASGKKKLLLVFSDNQNSSDLGRIEKSVKSHAKLISRISPGKVTDLQLFIKANKKVFSAADIIAFIAKDDQIIQLASKIRSLTGKSNDTILVGRSDWPEEVWNNSAYEGMIMAKLQTKSLILVGERFKNEYSRPMPLSSAYAYDLIAIASGLVRAKGSKAISRSSLMVESGFRGATGIFRFKSDGSVERIYEISQVKNVKLTTIREVPEGY